MSLPLSDADTTFMPELHNTQPYRVVIGLCGWCGIRLTAIPDAPRQIEPGGDYYHPGGCISAARGLYRGEETNLSAILTAAEGAASGQ